MRFRSIFLASLALALAGPAIEAAARGFIPGGANRAAPSPYLLTFNGGEAYPLTGYSNNSRARKLNVDINISPPAALIGEPQPVATLYGPGPGGGRKLLCTFTRLGPGSEVSRPGANPIVIAYSYASVTGHC